MLVEVLIIGGGLTAAVLSRALHGSNKQVLVVEKARGPGGRSATKRLEVNQTTLFFNTGLRGWPVSSEIQQLFESKKWPLPFEKSTDMHSDRLIKYPELQLRPESPQPFCSSKMNQWVKDLFEDQPIEYGWEASEIEKHDRGFLVRSKTGATILAKKLVITAPWPQTQKLCKSFYRSASSMPGQIQIDREYQAVLTIMVVTSMGSSKEIDLEHFENTIQKINPDWKVSLIERQNGWLVGIADRPLEESDRWMNQPLEDIEAEIKLRAALKDLLLFKVHRWKYAYPLEYFNESHFEDGHLFVAGDVWTGDSKKEPIPVQAAIHSALAVAARLAE